MLFQFEFEYLNGRDFAMKINSLPMKCKVALADQYGFYIDRGELEGIYQTNDIFYNHVRDIIDEDGNIDMVYKLFVF